MLEIKKNKKKGAMWKKRARAGYIPTRMIPDVDVDMHKRKQGPSIISPINHKRLKLFDVDCSNDDVCNEAGTAGQPRQDE